MIREIYSFIYYCFYKTIRSKNLKHQRAGFLISISASNVVVGVYIFLSIYLGFIRVLMPVVYAITIAAIFIIVYVINQKHVNRRAVYSPIIERYKISKSKSGYYGFLGLLLFIVPWLWLILSFLLPGWL